MSRVAAKITQADVARALRAITQVAPGQMVVEITVGGTIRMLPREDALAIATTKKSNVTTAEDFVL